MPSDLPDFFPDDVPLFAPGQLVRHMRYGYRGVVVDFDMVCRADDSWYHSNRTRPDRDQPWYHVLVDGADAVTYAAQTSLTADTARDPVRHPLLAEFFCAFDPAAARYERNDALWPVND